jgi:M6 family metalloprotease-like protein
MGHFTRIFSTILKILIGLFLLITNAPNIYSVGAYPYPQKIKQPDGSPITIRVHGDEWYNWISTNDGYRVLKSTEGYFEYATLLKSGKLVSSGIKASDPEDRSSEEKAFLSSTTKHIGISKENYLKKREERYSTLLKSSSAETYFPSEGSPKLLVILANFSDTQPTYTKTKFNNFMNQTNYNGTGSFKDYYLEVSRGQLNVNSTVTDWVEVSGVHDYYGPEGKWKEFALQAVQQASAAGIDFSQFDNDGDGTVEGVAIIHQGAGQEVTSDVNDIWSHSYSFSSWGISESERTFNGVVVDHYTIQPEWRSIAGDVNTIGVICHEFGHNMGLIDFYDVDESTNGQYDGTGVWDIMASGTYNGSPTGAKPAHHNPLSKAELGWVNVNVINETSHISLNPVYSSGEIFRVNSPVDNEYLLLENRQKKGFDQPIPYGGMLVYHADGNLIEERRASNNINIDEHQGFYPIAANSIINDASCPFPGTGNVTKLTDTGTPSVATWDGQPFNRSITSITLDNDSVISFDFMSIQDGSPLAFNALAADEQSIDLSWTPSSDNYPVLLAWSPDGIFGDPIDGQIYSEGESISGGGAVLYYGSSETTTSHTGLDTSTKYHYSIWSNKGDSYSQSLKDSAQTKPAPVTSFPWHDGFEDGFSNWYQEFVSGDLSWSTQSISNNDGLIEPYSGTSYATYYLEGRSSPSTRLISPKFELQSGQTYVLHFRHIQTEWEGDQDTLKVLVRTESSGTWQEIADYGSNITEWAEHILDLPYSEPFEIAFEGTAKYGYGIGIDDVEIVSTNPCQIYPDVSVSNITVSNITKTSMDLSWNRGNGDAVLVVARKDTTVYELPDNGTTYSAGSEFGTGDMLSNGTYVVYNGTGTSITLTGLTHTSTYNLAFFEYYSENVCYQNQPVTAAFDTEPNIYNITISVTDTLSAPIENAMVLLGADTLYTDSGGDAIFQLIHSELYNRLDVSKNSYSAKSTRFIPDGEKTIDIELSPFTPLAPYALTGTKDYRTFDLKWEPVINDNFENYLSYSTDIEGWTFLDEDQAPTYGISNASWPGEKDPMAFMVLDVYVDDFLQMARDFSACSGSKVLAAFSAQSVQSSDWIISPEFLVKEGDFFSFICKTLDAGTWGKEFIYVKIRLSGESAWTTLFSDSVPESWTRFEFDLTDYIGKNVELAVQNAGKDTFVLLLDDFRVGPELGPLSYKPAPPQLVSALNKARRDAYQPSKHDERAAKLAPVQNVSALSTGNVEYVIHRNGEEMTRTFGFASNSVTDNVSDCSSYEYTVSAIYADVNMESAPTDPLQVESCYSVLFVVKDPAEELLQGAQVTFNNGTQYTDVNGEALFSAVPSGSDQEYIVSANNYDNFQGLLNISSDSSVTVTMQVSSGLNDNQTQKITFSPNPVSSKGTLSGLPNGEYQIDLYEITGKKIEQKFIQGGKPFEWDLAAISPGVYMVIISQKNKNTTHRLKIIKQK